ncbi:MAG TPA: hypothetical protein VGD65_17955 [Chryseosolibacter sp.]
MEDHRFHEGKLPSAYRYNFEQRLFNTEGYRLLQSSNDWKSFYVLNESELLVQAEIHFHVKNGIAKSSVQSPFGGIEGSDNVNPKTLFHFIEFVIGGLLSAGCRKVIIIGPPLLYHPERQSMLQTFLLNLGFSVLTAEISSIIKISDKPFSEILHNRKRRKLNQSLTANLDFRLLQHNSLEQVYEFIEAHRKLKEYELSISLHHLAQSVAQLGDAYILFGVYENRNLVAASVAVRVSKNILYHFISDHVKKIDEARPALILMNGIYEYCQREKINMLDLGTSATDGLPNFKLIKFKTELGGQLTPKLTFTKQLT